MSNQIFPLCVVCGAPASFYATRKDRLYPELPEAFDMYRCPKCGLIFIDPCPQKDILEKHYPRLYTSHHVFEKNEKLFYIFNLKRRAFRGALAYRLQYGVSKPWQIFFFPYFLRIARFPTFKKEGSVLDVGCGSGKFLYELSELGWKHLSGIDSSILAVQAARTHGFNVRHGELFEGGYVDHLFDAVTYNHVFEHLADPRKILRETRRILKPGGELVITLPNTKGLLARLFGPDWFGLEIPRHLYNYNQKNLKNLLRQSDFEIQSCTSLKIFGTFMSSVSFRIGREFNTNTTTMQIFSFCLRVAEFVLDYLFSLFYLGDELVIRATRK